MANNGIPCNTDIFPQEIKLLLEELNVERKELDVQINEKRAQLLIIKKDIGKEEENLQGIVGQITRHKIGMSLALLDGILCGLKRYSELLVVRCCSLLFLTPSLQSFTTLKKEFPVSLVVYTELTR